jgi:hypothetical protein
MKAFESRYCATAALIVPGPVRPVSAAMAGAGCSPRKQAWYAARNSAEPIERAAGHSDSHAAERTRMSARFSYRSKSAQISV